MNPEIKKQWVKALRSGEYEQGEEYLIQSHDNGEIVQYCCLGVLCEILNKNPTKIAEEQGEELLPDWLLKEIELPYDTMIDLANRNDGGRAVPIDSNSKYHKHTFEELADHIENIL